MCSVRESICIKMKQINPEINLHKINYSHLKIKFACLLMMKRQLDQKWSQLNQQGLKIKRKNKFLQTLMKLTIFILSKIQSKYHLN